MDLKRGAIVLTALSGDFGKPRPALIIQSNWAMELPSITLLPITSTLQAAPLLRVPISPRSSNGLLKESEIMVDKIQTTRRHRVAKVIGHCDPQTLAAVESALALFLGYSEA